MKACLRELRKYHAFEKFEKPKTFFLEKIPQVVQLDSTLLNAKTVEFAKSVLLPAKRGIEFEDALVGDLQRLTRLFNEIMYSYPVTLAEDDDFCHADSKQGCFYSIRDSYDDIIFKYELSGASRKNRKRGLKDYIDSPRIKLSTDRIEELRIATVVLYETIRTWVCSGMSGDESEIGEREYLELLSRANNIVKNSIEF